jgi:hypothetical protein
MIIHWTESRVHKEKWAGSALQISRSALRPLYSTFKREVSWYYNSELSMPLYPLGNHS